MFRVFVLRHNIYKDIASETDQRINGSTDQRNNGSTDQRINGSTDQRINGSTDQHNNRDGPLTSASSASPAGLGSGLRLG